MLSPGSSPGSNPTQSESGVYPWAVYKYTIIVSLSGFASGFTIGSLGPTVLYIGNSIKLSWLEMSIFVSIVLVGALFGTFLSGIASDRFGRKWILVISGLVGLIASCCSAVAQNSVQLISSRFVCGVAVGATTVVAGLFSAETSPTDIRGSLQGYVHLAGWVGGILANFLGIIVIEVTSPSLCWRINFLLSGICYIPAITWTLWKLPESPRWLVSKNRDEEALELLRGIYGPGREQQVHTEYKIMQQFSGQRSNLCSSGREFFNKTNRRPMFIAMVLQALQQLSGNNMITFYSTIILNDLGFTPKMSVILTAISILPQVLIVWAVVHTLDRIGRRLPLLFSMAGTAFSLFFLACILRFAQPGLKTWLSLVGILLNRVFFSAGLGPLPAVVAAEILPFPIRGRGLAAAIAMGEMFKIVSVISFLPLTKVVHPSIIYFTLGVVMCFGFLHMLVILYETKGSPLDAIRVAPLKSTLETKDRDDL